MARDRAPSFQFYPRDFVSDPAVMAMGLAAVGAYIRLLCAAWVQDEPGVLPADDRVLGRLAQATPAEWRKVRAEVAAAFDTDSRPGLWVQRRMVAVRAEQQERYNLAVLGGDSRSRGLPSESRSEIARRAAVARWSKREDAC